MEQLAVLRKSELSHMAANAQAAILGGCKTLFDAAATAFNLCSKECIPYMQVCKVGHAVV